MDALTIAVRFGLYCALAVPFGLAAFASYGLTAGERIAAFRPMPWLIAGAVSGLLLSLASIDLMAAAMAGVPAWPVDHAAIEMLLGESATGLAWQVRVAALGVSSVAAMGMKRSAASLALVVVASGVALATLAWTGHGAMDDGAIGWIHLIADILHLLAAGLWSGALLGLILLVARPAAQADAAHLHLTHRALHGFGAIGTVVVGVIVVTGLVSGWLLVGPGQVATLTSTLYGRLLIAKLVLFAAMFGLAALNRFRLTPRLQVSLSTNDHWGALSALRRSLAIETGCIIAILALVAWLGTLDPAASAF